MDTPAQHAMTGSDDAAEEAHSLVECEWLVANGLGGYASATVSGACTRRYHGLLIAALPAPFGRMVMLNHLAEHIKLSADRVVQLGGGEDVSSHGPVAKLLEFRLESGLPVWRYAADDLVLEKRLVLSYRSNTLRVLYRMLSGSSPIRLRLRPSVHFRPHESSVAMPLTKPYDVHALGDRVEIVAAEMPTLRLHAQGEGASLVLDGGRFHDVFYRIEQSRGYDGHGRVWSPGLFRIDLAAEGSAALTVSTDPWDTIASISADEALAAELERRQRLIAVAPAAAQSGAGAELVLAADQFIVEPTTRPVDAARARAAGDEARTVIAGYHWFTDWGRDTMISLEGLTLATGRTAEAGYILRTFAHHVRDGLIPNLFPEGESEGLYHTADATLWFFHAIDRYVRATHDRETLRLLLPTLRSIVEHHQRGTHFGIRVDGDDGLLRQGADGYQLTWMDAKVDDWVVTPRRGKAVEINALWYNALRLMENWLREENESAEAAAIAAAADRACESFNRRFWHESGGYLYDVIDSEKGDDASLRPNQVLAISLAHPVLEPSRWPRVLDVVTERLLTPVGLRSLAPSEPDYKARYYGDLRSRDAAYHQGTVWAWLIGPYVDAWLKVHPGHYTEARKLLDGLIAHLEDGGIGSINEIFDAESPYTPRGCIAQAWSVAEVLRLWLKTEAAAAGG